MPEAEDLDAVQSLNFSSLEVTWPGGTAWISWGSCGQYLRGELCTWQEPMQECTLVGLAAETQGVFLHDHHEIHLANNSFFSEAPSPVLVILS